MPADPDDKIWGVIDGVHAFAPAMVRQAEPSAIVNTGSKQGITTPPGDAAYNVSKADVKVVTEALAHELGNTEGAKIIVHLLIPGFTFTGLTAASGGVKPVGRGLRTRSSSSCSPPWQGRLYILCPDNDVT